MGHLDCKNPGAAHADGQRGLGFQGHWGAELRQGQTPQSFAREDERVAIPMS
jgi:hypothetical protein